MQIVMSGGSINIEDLKGRGLKGGMMENDGDFAMNVSCPTCGENIIMSFHLASDDVSIMDNAFHTLGMDDYYTFRGYQKCSECVKTIVGCLTISSSSL